METEIKCVVCVTGKNNVGGTLVLSQRVVGSSAAPVSVVGTVAGLKAGKHSIVVHEFGDISDDGAKTGGVFSPKGHPVGMLGAVEVAQGDDQLPVQLDVSVPIPLLGHTSRCPVSHSESHVCTLQNSCHSCWSRVGDWPSSGGNRLGGDDCSLRRYWNWKPKLMRAAIRDSHQRKTEIRRRTRLFNARRDQRPHPTTWYSGMWSVLPR
eukprot:m.37578 g.37578  ORF g.37578 m.37578 type:complete len:208 (-) comp7714_c0_seq2:122-745(-)